MIPSTVVVLRESTECRESIIGRFGQGAVRAETLGDLPNRRARAASQPMDEGICQSRAQARQQLHTGPARQGQHSRLRVKQTKVIEGCSDVSICAGRVCCQPTTETKANRGGLY